MSRSSVTLLYFSSDRASRVDLTSHGAVSHSVTRPASGDRFAVASTLLTGPRPAQKTWVIDEAAWTQTLLLPKAALDGLDPAEASHAIGFELEPLSGVPAMESATGHLPGEPASDNRVAIWVTQVRAEVRANLESTLASANTRLAGILSPVGLVVDAEHPATIEIWDQATCLRAGTHVRIVAARPGQRSWQQAFEEFSRGPAKGKPITWTGSLRPTAAGLGSHENIKDAGRLAVDQDAIAWLARLGPTIGALAGSVPVVAPMPRAASRATISTTALIAFLAVAAWCVWDIKVQSDKAKELEDKAARLEATKGAEAGRNRQKAQLAKQIEDLKKANDPVERRLTAVEAEIRAQRTRLLSILEALSTKTNPEIMLTAVRSRAAGAIEVEGVGAKPTSASQFTADLAPALKAVGCEVQPVKTSADTAKGGMTFQNFAFVVAPVAAAPMPPPPSEASQPSPIKRRAP